ncbi:protein piccolo-like [Scleropages formosus]|uniref:Protein piccolo-like n=1 Tax=Scleropages formosus TaxID=113540 RepID=A0A0P7VCK8_SCLFO|nr:protein piccolo-like [Scleropages formosus]
MANEWLCLNCQTQRALSGQLGDMASMLPQAPVPTKPSSQQPMGPKGQPTPVSQPATQPKAPEPTPLKPTPIQQKTELSKTAPFADSSPVAPSIKASLEPSDKPGDVAQTVEKREEVKRADIRTKQEDKHIAVKANKEKDDKCETSSQQKSPQGLSDTGYSSEGLSGSLGDVVVSTVQKELLKDPVQKEAIVQETSPTSPSDLAKLESTVLSILEAKTSSADKDPSHLCDQEGNQHRRKLLPISPESFSSEEEDLDDFQEDESPTKDIPSDAASRRDRRKLQEKKDAVLARRQRQDSMEDSSGSEPSPLLQRRKISTTSSSSEEYKPDSPGSGDDEEFIRKQIMEMSADEDASGSDEDNYVRRQVREQEHKREQDERKGKGKIVSGKSKRPMKKAISSQEEDLGRRPSQQGKKEQEQMKIPEPKSKDTKSQEEEELSAVGGLRRFKTIELNNTTATPYEEATPAQKSTEGDLDMESLTDSPEDRSRGEGSSSLHASSFTPGTSPTSVSSLDEDSDSSPSHKRMSGEGKHRKARHRQHGQVLPTIEDSSEEDEMREEEELLKEQEKQKEVDQQQQVKKSSSKKSKKDKEELRAQRRREHPKTPPSNLSPIEDASPTEELRQAAEMEELHKSSCSEYSPSIESEPEGFQINPEKILAVQKVYQLPTSVSLYSPTEEQNTDTTKCITEKSLKTADEAYEEIMQKAKSLQGKKVPEAPPEKEPLYGGMLIEDYIYESLVEEAYDETMAKDNAVQQEEAHTISVQKPVKKLRSPDEVYEDMMQKKKDLILKEKELRKKLPVKETSQIETVLHHAAPEIRYVTVSTCDSSTKDDKPLLDAEAAYEELMKRQRVNLTPGTSPTQPAPDIHTSPEVIVISSGDGFEDPKGQPIALISVYDQELSRVTTTVSSDATLTRALYPIPDLKITQCSSGEEDIEDEDKTAERQEAAASSGIRQNGDDQSLIKEQQPATSIPTVPSSSDITATKQSIKTTGDFQQPKAAASVVASQMPVVASHPIPAAAPVSASAPPLAATEAPSSTPLPQYTPTVPSVMSMPVTATILAAAPTATAPPVPPKPAALLRGSSLERTDTFVSAVTPPPPPPPPPLPPPIMPKPAVYPKKKLPISMPPVVPASVPVSTAITMAYATITTTGPSAAVKISVAPTYRPHVPPPVPPKPSSIPAGLMFTHKPGESAKPPLAPKPVVTQPALSSQSIVMTQSKPTAPPSTTTMTLNLSAPAEVKLSITSPKSPLSPRYTSSLHETYVVITLPSEPGTPVEGISTQAPTSPSLPSPSKQPLQVAPTAPVAFTQYTKSIESQEMRVPEKLVSSTTSHMYSSVSAASVQPDLTLPNLVAQVVTTEVQKTTVSVVEERLQTIPPTPAPRTTSVAVTVSPGIAHPQMKPKENQNMYYSGDVVDLRTLKVNVEMTDRGMDLSVPDVKRTAYSSESNGRQMSAVHSEIVNLSAEAPPAPTLSVVTSTITIITCTATIAYNDNAADKPLDLAQSMTAPLQLTSKQFEPVAQIIYRPIDSQPTTSAIAEAPINLSFGAITSTDTSKPPVTIAPPSITNGSAGFPTHIEAGPEGAVDLTTSKPVQTMVAVNGVTSGVVTTIVEEDGKPMDLTAGRRAVCCDVVYKLPFAGSCTRPQAATTLPEDRFGYRDDHYQYDRSGSYSMRSFGGMKSSMSDTNLAEAGLFFYKSKNSYDYNGATEGAVDLTSGKISTGEIMDYSTKGTGAYSGMTIPPFCQARVASPAGTHFGVTSVLRSSNGVVYSSVAAPVPSTYAITTQPGSIFSTMYKDTSGMHSSDTMPSLSTLQSQPLPRSYSFLSTTVTAQEEPICLETGVTKSGLHVTFPEVVPTVTTIQDSYTDASLEAIAASLEALSSPIVPDDTRQQYQMEREYLEMEKMKQLRLAEELEWERQEIQRFQGVAQYIPSLPGSEVSLKETEGPENLQLTNILPRGVRQFDQQAIEVPGKKIVDSGVQTDDEDEMDRAYVGRRKRNKKSVDSSVQTDDEDQDEWDIPTRSRRRSRSSKYTDDKSKQGSKVSSIAIQTVSEISVQTDTFGTIKKPSARAEMDTKVEIVKHISAPEKTYRGGSLSCQTGTDTDAMSPTKDKRRPTPLEIGYNTHLKADSTLQVAPSPPKSPKVLYSPISPLSPSKSLEFVQYDKSVGDVSPQKVVGTEPSKPPPSPRSLKAMQRSMSDPKPLSPTSEERASSSFQYSDGYSGKASQTSTPSGTQKKVKRTLPNPPPEEESTAGQTAYSTGSARRRLCRNTTMARAKILQDIDRELDLVERESSKLRKKQAELDEEEKEIDAKLRYLEMGINRRKDALLKEREKRERAYLQGVAEERDYMSDSEVSNIRESRGNGHGLERPRTAPQSEFNQFIPPQTQPDAQYTQQTSPYTQYQYAPQTQAASQYAQQTPYQQQSLYHQQVSPYQTQSIYSSVPTLSYPHASHQQLQQQNYQHASQMLLMQQKPRQTTLSDLEPKITTNYEVIRNQPLMMVPSSTDSTYVPHLGGKYSSLDLRMGLDERSSMASSPMSSISADSFYADIDHHTPRNYVLIDDIGELTKGSAGLSSTFSIPDKDLTKADRLLRAAEVRRTAEVTDFLGPLQVSSRLHPYSKAEEDTMEDPYELKLLKQQIKQEFRRGTEGLEHLTGLPHYYPGDSSYRHFPKTEKYSISRLTLEKQAAKQLPASVLYQKQAKHKKALMDPKMAKFSPIQEGRDLEPDYSSYLASSASSVSGLASRARLLQDDITFGLRKNISEQQKYLGSTLGANLAQSLNLGQTLNLGPTMRSSLQDDTTYPSGSRSRPSSRPSSVYGLDLSLKRDLSSSSLKLKTDSEPLDVSYSSPSVRTKPTSLPISQSRGRIPIVAQNSEEESPLSPVGQPMGMARASAGPLPPISADSRDQFGSSHSLPEVQQHMREESRTRGYDRDIAFMMDDLQGAMSDSEAYHLRREETDWFDKPREARVKPVQYPFPHTRVKLQRDSKDHSVSGNGFGIRVVGGKEIPGTNGEIGAYIAKVLPGGAAEQTGKVAEGIQVLEWNGILLMGKTYEEVQGLVGQQCSEVEICIRLDLNMLSDSEQLQRLELHDSMKAGDRQRSPGVDPKQLAAELQKVSQQQGPSAGLSATEKGPHGHSGTTSAASSAVPSPGQPGSPSVSKKRHSSKPADASKTPSHPITGEIQLQINYDKHLGNLIVHVLQARNLAPRDNNGYSDPFVKVYLLPGRGAENKRRTKHAQKSLNPEWNQTVIYKNIHLEQLKKKTLEVTVWDYDRSSSNDFLGEVLIDLSNTAQLDNTPRWFPLKEQSDTIEHGRPHSGQGSNQQSPKPSVIKSRSHGIFPDPSKGREGYTSCSPSTPQHHILSSIENTLPF